MEQKVIQDFRWIFILIATKLNEEEKKMVPHRVFIEYMKYWCWAHETCLPETMEIINVWVELNTTKTNERTNKKNERERERIGAWIACYHEMCTMVCQQLEIYLSNNIVNIHYTLFFCFVFVSYNSKLLGLFLLCVTIFCTSIELKLHLVLYHSLVLCYTNKLTSLIVSPVVDVWHNFGVCQ